MADPSFLRVCVTLAWWELRIILLLLYKIMTVELSKGLMINILRNWTVIVRTNVQSSRLDCICKTSHIYGPMGAMILVASMYTEMIVCAP